MSLWSARSCGEAMVIVDVSGEYECVALDRVVITRRGRSNKVRVRRDASDYSIMPYSSANYSAALFYSDTPFLPVWTHFTTNFFNFLLNHQTL